MSESEAWYVVKQANGQCAILPGNEGTSQAGGSQDAWGPFTSEAEAIARRVGLIRAGKCQPA